MSVSSGFFNSINGDRKYDAEQMGQFFDGILTDGVYPNLGDEFVVTPGTGAHVLVGSGRAWFNRVWVYNDASTDIALSSSETFYGRYDAIVFDIDRTSAVREGRILVKKGTGSSNPQKPSMIHVDAHDQYPIAYIYRPARSTSISSGNIEYVVGSDACPHIGSMIGSGVELPLPISQGGTGATSVAEIFVKLGIEIPMTVAAGGTGATTPLDARRNLGIPTVTYGQAAPSGGADGDEYFQY